MVELTIHLEARDSDLADGQIAGWIRSAIVQESARMKLERERVYAQELLILDTPTSDRENLLSGLAAAEDTESMAEDALFLEEVLMLLTPKQRVVIIETVIEDLPEHIVAVEFKTSQQAIHRLKRRALKKLRHNLSGSIDTYR